MNKSNIINKSLTYLFFVTNITLLSNFFLVSDYTFFFQSKTLIYSNWSVSLTLASKFPTEILLADLIRLVICLLKLLAKLKPIKTAIKMKQLNSLF